MKFNTITRYAMAAGMSLALALGTVACSRDYTLAYVYAVSNSGGQISAYGVDYQSGVLTQISGSPFTSQLSNPITVLATPNGKTLYAIGGTQNNVVQGFSIGSDGKLYGGSGLTANITGTYPTAAAIDSTGTYLYVAYTYETGFGPVSTGPGGISIFPISQDSATLGQLGTPINVNVGNNPVAIAVSAPTCTATPAYTVTSSTAMCSAGTSASPLYPNVFVYVVDAETAAAKPTILGFSVTPGTGALTQLSSSVGVGVSPSSIAIDPTSKYLYVTDKLQNVAYGYQIASNNTGALIPLVSSPFATGGYPVSITIEPRGKYVYVANYNSNTVSSYSLNLANGSLGGSATVGGFTTATGPTCVTVEPALGIYLYTSNYLDQSISGGQLSPETGQLTGATNSPYPAGIQPACLTSVANGPHASQLIQQ